MKIKYFSLENNLNFQNLYDKVIKQLEEDCPNHKYLNIIDVIHDGNNHYIHYNYKDNICHDVEQDSW